ncbi:uncharacterized protein LOC124359009 [Homalodisca vitripennis]|uniref:uncharacterized protein LOC124359009 n=1 Tax=Homalodisca vitripennis TaxID=197043 RepID=UPI001EEAE207|nr:uncharacterized protein LOC124359009 [Homalodisca vitripennis]
MTFVKHALWIVIIYIDFIPQVKPAAEFDFETTDFSKIANTPAFVDKTLFIKVFIEHNKTSLITAPPGFGKSTILNMLKTFLEIEVYNTGAPKTNAYYLKEQVRDTRNYKLFDDNMFKISEDANMMKNHFGKTPVLSVSLKCEKTVNSFDDALEFFKYVVHDCYKQYRYLGRSEKLGIDQRQYIETWCDHKTYRMFGKHRVLSGLRDLSEFLYRHFNDKTVFVLIDDHDSVIKSAMLNVTDDGQLDDIVKLSVGLINSLLKNNRRHVHGGLITGVSDIPLFGSGLTDKDDCDTIMKYRFLGDHPFVDFFGLTKHEVDGLLVYPELKLGESVVDTAKAMYSGFTSKKGVEVANLYSILNFLKYGEIKNYWQTFNPVPNLDEALKVPLIKKSIEKMLTDDSINIEISTNLTLNDIIGMRNFLNNPQSQAVSVAIKYFSFLFEEGYLAYALDQGHLQNQVNGKNAVRMPNDEIKEIFTQALK